MNMNPLNGAHLWITLALGLLGAPTLQAQAVEKLVDVFTLHPNKQRVLQDSSLYPSRIILAPIINYSPETRLGLGLGAKYLFKLRGSGEETRTSNMPVSFVYTLENQFVAYSGFEVFSKEEKWMLTGNLILQDFPRLFFGIGRDTPVENEERYEYKQILLEPILLKRVFARYLFVGAGLRYNRVGDVLAQEGGLLANSEQTGTLGSTSVGAELALVYDSRNNILNANNGWYVEATHGFYGKVLGGTHQFQLSRLDVRHYWKLSPRRPDVLAFQLRAHVSHAGTPFNELAFFGSNEIMRGFYEGRYIATHMLALQAEYRMQFFDRLGGVFFVSVGDVANGFDQFAFRNLRPSAGFGLRFTLDKVEQLNLRFDWGFTQRDNNYYLNIAEAF